MIKIIAAMTPSRVIGKSGKLPWTTKDVPGELRWFQEATNGQVVVMGRKTWDSLSGAFKPLPNRENVIVSRSLQKEECLGATVVKNLSGVCDFFAPEKDVWIIGGSQIYTEALAFADELYLTILESEFEGDTYFPEFKNAFIFFEDVKTGQGWMVKKFVKKQKSVH